MSDQGVSFTVASEDTISAALLAEIKKICNVTPLLEEFAASNLAETQHRFEKHKDATGKVWKGYALSTLAKFDRRRQKMSKKKRSAYTPQLLRDTGELYDSMVWKVTPYRQALVGTNKIYARTHQLGDPKRNIPARPYLGISADGWRELQAIVADHLKLQGTP